MSTSDTANEPLRSDWLRRYRWLLELGLFSCLSLFWLFLWAAQGKIYLGDDLGFHLNRVQGLYQQLISGHWGLGHIATTTFQGWGYPINLFYPAYTLLPMAVLQVWVGGVHAYAIFLFLITLLTLYTTRFVGQRVLGSYYQGLLLAVLYSFSQYRVLDFFVRGALAEGIVFAFLPLVFYGAYSIAIGDVHQWYWLALGMALIGLTHVVSLILASVLVLLTLGLFFLKRMGFQQRLGALILAVVTTGLLALTFLAPLMEQLHHMQGLGVMQFQLASSAVQPWPFLVNSAVNQMGSGQINLGWLMLMLLILTLGVCWKFNGVERYLVGLAVGFVWLATTWFPWSLFQGVLGTIQFPWRFLAIASFLIALVGTRALVLVLPRNTRRVRGILLAAMVALGIILNAAGFVNFFQNPYSNAITPESYHTVATDVASTDYVQPVSLPAMPALKTHSIVVMNPTKGQATLRQTSRQVGADSFTYRLWSRRARRLKLPHLAYPGYQVTVNGHRQPLRQNRMAILLANVKQGTNIIRVAYVATPIQRVSAWISALAWVALLGWLGWKAWRRLQR